VEPLSPEVLEDLRAGRAPRERKIAVCAGGAHLAPADRAEILAVLAGDADEMVSERAQQAILSQPVETFVEALKREKAIPALFAYAGKHLADKPGICDALVQNKNCGAEYLIPVARSLSSLAITTLMDELERVSESPALAAALEHSSSITADQKHQLHELLGSAMDEATLAEAAAEAEPDMAKRQTLIMRLAKMGVSERVQFAMKGGSKVVQRAVLQSPRLTDQEVEAFATMTSLTDEILRLIAGNRKFRKNYAVVRNLLNNPKTPLDVSLHMLPMCNVMDLKKLTTNKNVPETLRSTALKLQRTRAELKK
jgi:hypothetical protein